MNKIKSIETVIRIVKIDNSGDTNRTFHIEANAEIKGNELAALHDGVVRSIDEVSAEPFALFSMYGDDRLSLNILRAVDETMVLSVIKAFKTDVESELATL